MNDSEVYKLANELNLSAEKQTLSHAVLATRIMLEEKNYSINSDRIKHIDIKKKDKNVAIKELNELAIEQQRLQKIKETKVYISLEYSGGNCLGARTFYYKRESIFDNSEQYSVSEHYDIFLPKSNKVIEYNEKKFLSKKCHRFAVGHELGHLWLHLDELKKHINNMQGTNLISDTQKEHEATIFSLKLSELRDKHLKEYQNNA